MYKFFVLIFLLSAMLLSFCSSKKAVNSDELIMINPVIKQNTPTTEEPGFDYQEPSKPTTKKIPNDTIAIEDPQIQSNPQKVFRVQLYAFSNYEAAQEAKDKLVQIIADPIYIEQVHNLYKVRTGDFETRLQAENFLTKLKDIGFFDAFITETYSQ